jgi:hypothetical protein
MKSTEYVAARARTNIVDTPTLEYPFLREEDAAVGDLGIDVETQHAVWKEATPHRLESHPIRRQIDRVSSLIFWR